MTTFHLKIRRLDRHCLFELAWGKGQQLSATVEYPEALTQLYQEWQRAYLSFYKSAQLPIAPTPTSDSGSDAALRGRVGVAGSIVSPPNWQAKLVQAEASLLYEFHRWLRNAELFEIRQEIARSAAAENATTVTVFLTCDPIDLERFPWEAWEVATELGTGKVRIARSPLNIRAATVQPPAAQRRKVRILAILGDDTGLNFQTDREAVRSLAGVAEIHFMGWQAGQQPEALKQQINDAIAAEPGWDGLFFAGHSNEMDITGGELAIAPRVVISLRELGRSLTLAKQRGLQFAVFNSCCGLNIAQTLISLGLSQVVIMREPIHNRVAQEFLIQFLRSLATFQDIHGALLSACEYLQLERHLTFPSTYLVPSLFCHPEATLFRIQPRGWKQRIQPWLPTRYEAIALAALLLLSTWAPLQNRLLDQRLWAQALFRDRTGQVPQPTVPPVRLVQIDEVSIRKAGITSPSPIDRQYLARLIDRLTSLKVKVVGLDYLLDRQQPAKDPILAQAVKSAVQRQQTRFVLGARLEDEETEVGTSPETGIANPNWSLQGHLEAYFDIFPWYMELLSPQLPCAQVCPFAYLLTLSQVLEHAALPDVPQPRLQNTTDLRTQLSEYLQHPVTAENPVLTFLQKARFSSLSKFAESFQQTWLMPILDFSIPPNQVYDSVSAWQLLDPTFALTNPSQLPHQVVIIAPGGYDEAGVVANGTDNFPPPQALRYWRSRSPTTKPPTLFTGSEAHAYMIYQFLHQRLVVPVPDLWMVGVAALLGKGVTIGLRQQSRRRWLVGLSGLSLAYGLVSLQLYISAGVLFPWFLPSAAVWVYGLPVLRRKAHE